MENKQLEVEVQPSTHSYWHYMMPANFSKIISHSKAIFGIHTLIGYIGYFFLIVIGINLYSDHDRFKKCGGALFDGDEASSEVYDMAIMLLVIHHIIEWVRVIIFGVCVIIGANLMIVWYATSINTLFGIIVYCHAHAKRFNAEGR